MIIDQLTYIYINQENWHEHKLSKEDSDAYHERLLMQGNIITYIENNELLGYLEFYRINFEQFGRMVCDINIPVFEENILDGNIALVKNMWITSEKRHSEVFEFLSAMFLSRNRDADFFVAFRRTKHSEPLLVYSRDDLKHLYNRRG